MKHHIVVGVNQHGVPLPGNIYVFISSVVKEAEEKFRELCAVYSPQWNTLSAEEKDLHLDDGYLECPSSICVFITWPEVSYGGDKE